MTSAPLRFSEASPRRDDDEDEGAVVVRYALNRQCGLCEHPCFEFDWICMCCCRLEGGSSICYDSRARVSGPLLPPFVSRQVVEGVMHLAALHTGRRSRR